jgi:PhnB protein
MASGTDKVSPIPEGYHALTPYLTVRDGDAAIRFYVQAFGASELYRMTDDNGRVSHAEIQIGDSRIMLADEFPEKHIHSPQHYGGTSVNMLLYVEDVDAVHARAVAAGALELRKMADQPYGDRSCVVADPFGHQWILATHFEDVSPEEMKRRMGLK